MADVPINDGVKLTDTLNSHWKSNKSNFGFRMLMKMGWQEDQGLGKDLHGEVSHVKVKKRQEGMGLAWSWGRALL